MKPLPEPHAHHLRAAEGWTELRNYRSASEELKQIEAKPRAHPLVFMVRWAWLL